MYSSLVAVTVSASGLVSGRGVAPCVFENFSFGRGVRGRDEGIEGGGREAGMDGGMERLKKGEKIKGQRWGKRR